MILNMIEKEIFLKLLVMAIINEPTYNELTTRIITTNDHASACRWATPHHTTSILKPPTLISNNTHQNALNLSSSVEHAFINTNRHLTFIIFRCDGGQKERLVSCLTSREASEG